MKSKISTALVLLLISSAASTSAYAISHNYRAQLERSGCTEINAGVTCDINKTRAQNAAHTPTKAQQLQALIYRVEGMPVEIAYSRLRGAGWKQSADPTLFIKPGAGASLRITREDNRITKVAIQPDDGE